MYLHKIPAFIHHIYPHYTWKVPTKEKALYLTFDDGPTEAITEWVLEQLASFDAKATFFMIGKNVRQLPEIAHKVIDAGHAVGNHTQHHANGWKTDGKAYLKEVMTAQNTIWEYTGYNPTLFRPPYGRITSGQARHIRKSLDIIMMNVISGDFDLKYTGAECAAHVVDHADVGDIVVFHDSQKAWDRMSYALPRVLEHFSEAGYEFKVLEPNQVRTPSLPICFM